MKNQISKWHRFIESLDAGILNELFAEDIKFHSPFFWKPKEGKPMAIAIITTVAGVFEEFSYVREIVDGNNCALEFEARIGDLTMRGVDLIEFNDSGLISDFEVMIRPANALQKLGMEMAQRMG